MRTWKWLLLLLTILGLAAGAWWQRDTLRSWYYLYRLHQADELDRPTWIERLVALDERAVPTLVDSLGRHDESACACTAEVLSSLVGSWPVGDERRVRLAARLASRFPRYSPAGQCAALDLVGRWVKAEQPGQVRSLHAIALRLLPVAGRSSEAPPRAAALALTGVLMEKSGMGGGIAIYRELVGNALEDPATANRVQAIHLAGQRDMNLLPRIAPLLDDAAAEVRQAAMLAIGGNPEAVATDDLLRSLHDTDADVRRLCEAALKSRGLRGQDLAMARLITDTHAGTRLQVLQALQRTSDLDAEVWLRRLSHDPEPAVRASVLRAAAEVYDVDLRDRMEQIASDDPSPTVRQVADHFLRGSRNAERGTRNAERD